MQIHTHINVDLDAVCSVWAVRTFIAPGAQVAFHPANWDGAGMQADDIAVDIEAGGRGIKGWKDGYDTVHACFAMVMQDAPPGDRAAMRPVIDFVDAQDAYGSAVRFLAPGLPRDAEQALSFTGLNAVLRALQSVYDPPTDGLVCLRMAEILDGMLHAGRSRQQAVEEATHAVILGRSVPGREVTRVVAIGRNHRHMGTNAVLFEDYGVKAIVYVDGNNLGIVRRDDVTVRMDHPDLRAVVAPTGEDWFAHPAGFLFCRGSRKAPAETPSKVDPMALATAAVSVLEESNG